MDQRLPDILVPLFQSYLSAISQRLPDMLDSFYVVGSIALDEFNPHFSDVDFVAVLNHPATDQELRALHTIHQEVERQHPRWKHSGMYLLKRELGKMNNESGDVVGYHDGRLDRHTSLELNPVTWWILKKYGIPLLGPDPRTLPLTTNADVLVAWTLENMNTYWLSWTRQPGRLVLLGTDWGIQWAVLGVLRQFYTIREKSIITKQRAGEYALPIIPHTWHRIINEAMRIRAMSGGFLYASRIARASDAVQCIRYVIQVSNESGKTAPQGEAAIEVDSV